MGKCKKKLFGMTILASFLAGCSDNTSSINPQEAAIIASQTTESGYDLGACTADKVGTEVLVYEEMAYYICTQSGAWTHISVRDYLASDTESSSSEVSAVTLSSSSSEEIPTEESSSSGSNIDSSSESSGDSSNSGHSDVEASSSSEGTILSSSSAAVEISSSSTASVAYSSSTIPELFFTSTASVQKCPVSIYASSSMLDITPNDWAAQDSAGRRLANGGAYLRVIPGGSYTLSFNKTSGHQAPVLYLQQITTRSNRKTYYVPAVDTLGRWFYSFTLPESRTNALASYLTALYNESDCSLFAEETPQVHLSGFGSYSSHFEVNLIIMGKYMGTSDGLSAEALAEALKSRFNLAFSGSDVTVDKVNLLYSTDHPTYGSSFSEDEPYVLAASLYQTDYEQVSNWSGYENSLDIILGYYINKENVLGFAPRFGASLNGSTGGYSYVIIGTHYKSDLSSSKTYNQSSDAIVETIVHESGHYLGLRHTSSSMNDMANTIDKSNVEDGLGDTPYCAAVNTSTDYGNCGDRYNLIFPYSTDGYAEDSYTPNQLELIQKNLMLMEH